MVLDIWARFTGKSRPLEVKLNDNINPLNYFAPPVLLAQLSYHLIFDTDI